MTISQTAEPARPTPLRLWPGVAAALLMLVIRFGVPLVAPDAMPFTMLGGLAGALIVILWWAFFSRAPLFERWSAIGLMAVALVVTHQLLHPSIANAGMGMLFFILAIPVMTLALVAWAVLSRNLPAGPRRLTLAATLLISCGFWALLRTGGISNSGDMDFAWRWQTTPEELLLARADGEPLTPVDAADGEPGTPDAAPAWPGFRGPHRDGTVPGVRIATDWAASPPVEVWRRPVGPGWSSFAVDGRRFYTQEQRGDDEVVACYDLDTGEPVWRHGDAVRFWEANAGAGPRATPTLHDGRVYTYGGTGLLNALDARDGRRIWSRDTAADTGIETPYWGFSGSPLIVGDIVIVAVQGALAGYDLGTGEPRWSGSNGGDGYSSPHLLTLDGVEQVVLMSQSGAVSLGPQDGTVLWEYPWEGGTRIVQPALTADGDLLLSRGVTTGMRRVSVTHGAGDWTLEERWTSNRLKPYFSDFVVHEGHAYGFDGNILASVDVEDGERNWKGGRYGSGQLVLLPDQDLLLVVSEKGGLALVGATPERFTEIATFPALEGKTWNHPVVVGELLLVRNDEEMVAFRLSPARGQDIAGMAREVADSSALSLAFKDCKHCQYPAVTSRVVEANRVCF